MMVALRITRSSMGHVTGNPSGVNRRSNGNDRCEGHGRCWETAPELIEDDERGRGLVRGDGTIAPEQVENAQAAARVCPERAVEIVD